MDIRKTAVIDAELDRLNVDIAALKETRLPENGMLQEQNYTFFWKGKNSTNRREHGVGFAVRTALLPTIEPPAGGIERLFTLKLNANSGPVTLISANAPTLTSESSYDHYKKEMPSLRQQHSQLSQCKLRC